MASHLNMNPAEGTHWKGRVLVWLKAEDAKYPQAGKEVCLNEPDSDDSEDEKEKKDAAKGKAGGDEEKEPLLGNESLKIKKGETQQDRDGIRSAF